MKKLKGFTLIELIIVMAILVSVLTCILQLIDPINQAYGDSTVYEHQRTVENGIISYITESVRYADRISICDQGITTKPYTYGGSTMTRPISSESDAVTYFCEKNNIDMTDSAKMEKIQVIRIDRSTNYDGYYGRLIRRNGWNSSKSSFSGTMTNDAVSAYNTKDLYMAMGPAYYGKNTYEIVIPNKTDYYVHYDPIGNPIPDSELVEDNVSQLPKGFDVHVSVDNLRKRIETSMEGSVTIMNYKINITDIDYETNSQVDFGALSTSSGDGESGTAKDTYIVFTRPN